MGGWIDSAKSCSTGFKSAPSCAAGLKRRKGFEVHKVNSMKPELMRPMTPSTRLEKVKGSARLKAATATLQMERIRLHSSKESSCSPHSAATRYNSGNCELELRATYNPEKPSCTKQYPSQANAMATNAN